MDAKEKATNCVQRKSGSSPNSNLQNKPQVGLSGSGRDEIDPFRGERARAVPKAFRLFGYTLPREMEDA
ncbi:hypothetical protein EVAR_46599_1 [Eumeta japonica]|uniref:Uncharacterized protein n=1 Tax=Eumeta variegata TaxID=151549 RepID=A0A4C1WS12_EUMVA|nr:hypothetical protein EVAR_46599_1 [Eumeta japonica]